MSKKKKKNHPDLLDPAEMAGNGEDLYRPTPIFDDFSAHSEGCQPKLDRKFYEKELARLQVELVKMQYWIKHAGYRLLVLYEGAVVFPAIRRAPPGGRRDCVV